MLQAGDREEIVAIGRFPDVDQLYEFLAVVPEEARADLYASRGAMMRMAGHAQRTLAPYASWFGGDLKDISIQGVRFWGIEVPLDIADTASPTQLITGMPWRE